MLQERCDESGRKAADRALEAQGAKRAPEEPQSAAFTFNGLFWDSLRTVKSSIRFRSIATGSSLFSNPATMC